MKSLLIIFLILFSLELKADWSNIYTFPNNNCNEMNFINANTGFVSSDAVIFKTTNAGYNWISVCNYPAVKIQFINENTGFACTGNSILKTSNTGNNWFLVYEGKDFFTSFQMVDSLNGYAAVDSNGTSKIIFTDDGAHIWSTSYIGIDNLLEICFFDKNNGIASFHYLSNGADYSYILKTSNGGTNWDLSFAILWYPISNFQKLDSNTAIIAGNTYIMKTTNRGLTWVQRYSFLQYNINQIGFISGTTGFASTIGNTNYYSILRTTNGGQNWQTSFTVNDSRFNIILYVDNLTAFALNSSGKLYKTTNGGITNIEANSETPDEFSLSQNYPNPFNPLTRIIYELKITNYVSLKVYDALGNEVQTIVNEKQNAGSYSVSFNGANLPSGIYFYKLEAGNFQETRKMILLK